MALRAILKLRYLLPLDYGSYMPARCHFRNCLDTVSNGGFLQFSARGILSPLPGDLRRDYGSCDYDIRYNLTGQYVYELPIKARNHELGDALNG